MQKTLTQTVGEGMFWSSSSTIFLKGIGLASVFLILSRLSVYEYGLVELVLSIIPLMSIFLLPSLNSVVIADMGIEKGRNNLAGMKTIFFSFLKLQLIMAVIAWAIVFFGADIIANFYKGHVSGLLKIVSFIFLLSPWRTMITVVFNVYLKFFHQSLYSFFEELLKLILLIVMFFVFDLRTHAIILAIVLSQLFTIFLLAPIFLQAYKQFSSAVITKRTSFWNLLEFHGKWAVFSGYVGTFNQNIRLWIIKFLLGTEAVGLFAVAQGILGHTSSLVPLNKVVSSIIPQYIDDIKRFIKIINKSIKYQFLGFITVGVIGFFVFPSVISFLFPNYRAALPLFKILLFSLIPTSFDSIFASVFFALQAQRSLFFASIYKAILTAIALPLFIYYFSLSGIAYGLIFVSTFYVAERYRKLKQLIPGFAIVPIEFAKIDEFDTLIFKKLTSYLKYNISKFFKTPSILK